MRRPTGDFSRRLSTDGQRGVFKDLGENLNRLMDVVSRTVSEIKEAADVVSTSAFEISAVAASAEALEERARGLVELVSAFTLVGDRARSRARRQASPVLRAGGALRIVRDRRRGVATLSRPKRHVLPMRHRCSRYRP